MEEQVPEGETPPKEYDYLLTMPLWSLSEEKIAELTNQMNNKKDDHDQLEATHINTLWGRDLDAFLAALTKQEELDEKDRLAHKSAKIEGGKGGRGRAKKPLAAAPNKKGAQSGAAPKKTIKKIQGASQREGQGSSGAKIRDGSENRAKPNRKKDSLSPKKEKAELSLRERLALKAGVDAGKLPPRADPLHDKQMGTGKGLSSVEQAILKGQVGQRRRRDAESDDDSDFDDDYRGLNEMNQSQSSRGAQQRPRDLGRQRTSPPAHAAS